MLCENIFFSDVDLRDTLYLREQQRRWWRRWWKCVYHSVTRGRGRYFPTPLSRHCVVLRPPGLSRHPLRMQASHTSPALLIARALLTCPTTRLPNFTFVTNVNLVKNCVCLTERTNARNLRASPRSTTPRNRGSYAALQSLQQTSSKKSGNKCGKKSGIFARLI